MADSPASQSRLTVLTGAMAGKELVLEEAVDNVLIGSDPTCRFHLPVPSVDPIHARLWLDASGVTVYDTRSARGLYVNDDRVNGQASLRNGDILWLGSPGDDDVVMIQCRLPARPSVAPQTDEPQTDEPSPPGADEPMDAEQTLLIVADRPEPAAPPDIRAANEPEPAPAAFELAGDGASGEVTEEPALEVVDTTTAAPVDDFVIKESEEAQVAPAPPSEPPFDEEPTEKEPLPLDLQGEEPAPFLKPELPPPPPPPVFEDETDAATVAMPEAPLAAPPPHEPPHLTPPPTVAPPAPHNVAPPPPPPAPPRRPAPAPREMTPPPMPRATRGAPVGRYAGIVLLVVVLGVGGAFLALRAMRGGGATALPPAVTTTTVASARETTPTQETQPPETVAAVPPTTAPEQALTVVKPTIPTPPPATPATVKPTTPTPVPPTLAPAKTSTPTPAPTKAATPPPATLPAAPSAEAQRAQELAAELGQGDAAATARNYDQAVGHYDQALKLDPQNAKAAAGKTAAQAALAASRKTFVSGKTSVQSGKVAKGGMAGFDSEDVSLSKAPDYSGRIEFEVSPRTVKAGDGYTAHVYLTNDGKKPFKIGSLTVTTTSNGAKTGGAVTAPVKEVLPQQRVSLQDVTGVWQDGTTSWNLDVAVVSDRGDTFKNQVTWR